MSPLAYTTIGALPRVLLLVVALLGLIFSVKGRARGVPGLLVAAFVVVLITTAASIAWQFVVVNAPSWAASDHLSVSDLQLIFTGAGVAFDAAEVLSWLLVALAVVKIGRSPRQPGFAPHPGRPGYPMPPQPGFTAPPPGYPQAHQPPD